MPKIWVDKTTGIIKGFATGEHTVFGGMTNAEVIDVAINNLPDVVGACKWTGKKVIVDVKLKQDIEKEADKQKLIAERKDKIIEEQAIAELTAEGKI